MRWKVNGDFLWFERNGILSDEELSKFKPEDVESWKESKNLLPLDDIPSQSKDKDDDESALDFNDDGNVDDEDLSLAAKLMGKKRQKGKKKK
jgi:hypothetical protein